MSSVTYSSPTSASILPLLITFIVLSSQVLALLPTNLTVPSTSTSTLSIPQDFIDSVLDYFGNLSTQSAALNKHNGILQRRIEAPDVVSCDAREQWRGRVCRAHIGPRAFRDNCQFPQGPPHFGQVYIRFGLCPELTTCLPIRVRENNVDIPTALCAPSTPPREDNIRTRGQYGYRNIGERYFTGVEPFSASISLLQDFKGSSVSGELRSKISSSLLLFL